ncbi:phosphatase PAP2 family protein [Kluyvera intermedia]|uniref:acid phosphatase n=1 Tax=Kluyvera intermedia TaxID=61648 RepID=UPI0034A32869
MNRKNIVTKMALVPLLLASISSAFAETSGSFLDSSQVADSLTLLPAPPAYGSVAFLRDKAAYEEGHSQINTPRWEQAIKDADLTDSNIGKPFSEALGVDINPKNTPATYELLRKIRTDSGDIAPKTAKEHYMRVRPFMFFNTHTCTPNDEPGLRKNGSYPSGHTAIGWSTALILSEMRPDRENQILKRGYEFGQSRVICGAHWQSDVDAGRIIGSAEVARLHADKEFMQAFAKSKAEIDEKLKK